MNIKDYFCDVETTEEHGGYFYSVGEILTIVILGSLCGLRNVSQIHQWATNDRVRAFLFDHFEISAIPCYYWMLCLLKLIKPTSMNQCFINWVQSFLPDKKESMTISFDGKTIRSTGKMDKYDRPIHIVSAHLAELGITYGQYTVDGKSNEIPAMRKLLELLDVEGCMVVADAMHCQVETAKAITAGKADYLLNVKNNQQTLKEEIEDYVQDETLRMEMDTFFTYEKNRDRIELRVAFSTCDIDWLFSKEQWPGLVCIGAVNRQFTTKNETTDEWHYYISSRTLTAEALLRHARLEWSVESMHWLLDVHFEEDFCRVENKNVQENLNIVRKIALNNIKIHKKNTSSKKALSNIMLECLVDCENILPILASSESLA
jgi:predicted transposase YbfD/YdcC